MTNILQEQQQQCAQLLEIAMVSCKKIALWVDQVECTSRLSDSSSRQSCEQLAMDFVACFKSGENAEVLDQFFDFQLEAEAVAMYEELDEVVALQTGEKFSLRMTRVQLAKEFNRCLMSLTLVEEMWTTLDLAFIEVGSLSSQSFTELNSSNATLFLNFLGLHAEERQIPKIVEEMQIRSGRISPESILVSSPTFQQLLLRSERQDMMQALNCSPIFSVLPWSCVMILAQYARTRCMRKGESLKPSTRCAIAVSWGSVNVTYANGVVIKADSGTVVGEAWALFDRAEIEHVQANAVSLVIVVPSEAFAMAIEIVPLCAKAIAMSCVKLCGSSGYPNENLSPLSDRGVKKQYADAQKRLQKVELTALRSLMDIKLPASYALTRSPSEVMSNPFASVSERMELSACKLLMNFLREKCSVGWGDSKAKDAYLAFSMWKVFITSKRTVFASTPEGERCKAVQRGFEVMTRSWNIVAEDSDTVLFSHLDSLREHLGEVGQFFFDVAFPISTTQTQLTFQDFLRCWIRYLDQDAGEAEQGEEESDVYSPDMDLVDEQAGYKHEGDLPADARPRALPPDSVLTKVRDMAVFRRHRTIKFALLKCEMKTYTSCYEKVVGDVKSEMKRSRVLDFLSLLLIDLDFPLTNAHVNEFMEVFSPLGASGTMVTLVEIERGFLESSNKGPSPHRFFIAEFGSPLNPNSFILQLWESVQQVCAFYLVLHVPVRICFNPYKQFFTWEQPTLVLDLITDFFVACNIVLSFNVSFMVCACVCARTHTRVVSMRSCVCACISACLSAV